MMETDIMVGTAMKLTCSKEEFVSRLGIVSRAVSTRSSVQILAGVLLQASADELRLAATDMELSLRTSLDAQVEDEGSVVVPGPPARRPCEAAPGFGGAARASRRRGVLQSSAARRATGCTRTARRTFRGCPTSTTRRSSTSTRRRSWRRSRRSRAPRRATSRAPCSPGSSPASSRASS